jgi:nucleotide-binding universal stress UspA family protein
MTITQERPQTPAQAQARRYATLLVHAEPGGSRVAAAVALAQDFDAHLIGLGAETFEAVPDPGGVYGGEWLVMLQEQVNNDLQLAEKNFRSEAQGADYEWRSAQDYPNRAMARTARAADLLVASPRSRAAATSSVDPAELTMSVGRPVLLIPEGIRRQQASTIVVAWKDTREARRAVADALPFLVRADDVIIQAICAPDDDDGAVFQTADVVSALQRHGVAARPAVAHGWPDEVPDALHQAVDRTSADMIVAGAYGHSRAREWFFGGVTYELMHRPPCAVLFSH